jgi:hypothetical protein
MKAIRVHEFGGPEVLKLEDVTVLEAVAGQVVVQVKAAGVNPYDTTCARELMPSSRRFLTRRGVMRRALWIQWERTLWAWHRVIAFT